MQNEGLKLQMTQNPSKLYSPSKRRPGDNAIKLEYCGNVYDVRGAILGRDMFTISHKWRSLLLGLRVALSPSQRKVKSSNRVSTDIRRIKKKNTLFF